MKVGLVSGDDILPRLDDFRPDLIVISDGFDAHMRDAVLAVATRLAHEAPVGDRGQRVGAQRRLARA